MWLTLSKMAKNGYFQHFKRIVYSMFDFEPIYQYSLLRQASDATQSTLGG